MHDFSLDINYTVILVIVLVHASLEEHRLDLEVTEVFRFLIIFPKEHLTVSQHRFQSSSCFQNHV